MSAFFDSVSIDTVLYIYENRYTPVHTLSSLPKSAKSVKYDVRFGNASEHIVYNSGIYKALISFDSLYLSLMWSIASMLIVPPIESRLFQI